MTLSETQASKLNEYLSTHPRTCTKCGGSDWEFGDIQLPAAELTLGDEEIKASREFVEISCKRCGEPQAIDCAEAGLGRWCGLATRVSSQRGG